MSLIRFLVIALLPVFLCAEYRSVQVRGGYFYPASKTMRDIYANGGIDYEVEGAVAFCHCWSVWANVNFFERNGHSLGSRDRTSVQMCPLSLGVKCYYPLCDPFQVYLGVGGSYTWIQLHDHSEYVQEHSHLQGWGIVGKSGVMCWLGGRYFLDLFADYYYTKISGEHAHPTVDPTSQDIGGLRAGLGLGIAY